MTKTDIWEVDQKILYFLRREMSDPSNRGTTVSQTLTGDGTTKRFNLTNAPFHNVIMGTSDGARRKYGSEYTIINDMESTTNRTGTAAIVFGSAPGASDTPEVLYHYGDSGTWIYPDLPHERMSLSNYPRIGQETISTTMTQVGLGTGLTRSSMLKDIVVYAKNLKQLREIVNDVKDALITNKDQFHYFNFMQPVGMGPINKEQGRNEKVVSQNITVEIPYIFES